VWGGAIDNLITLGIPTAIGIALLRYRLYDIDRLINRTLVYGSLTAILGLGYAVVVVLGELLGQDTSLAVAGATLAMAAVFQPLRRRTQAVVDRRFNRRRHDAARPSRPSTPTFDQIDLDTLSAELAVVDQTMDRPRVLLRLQRPDRQALSTLRPDTHDLNRPSSQRDWPPTSIWLDQDHRRPAVEGKGRAFGACFAGKLRNPTPPTGRPGSPGPASGPRPLRESLRRPPAYPSPPQAARSPYSCPSWG